MQRVIHILNNIVWHITLALPIAFKTYLKRSVYYPDLDIGVTGFSSPLDNRLTMLAIDVGVVYNNIPTSLQTLFKSFEKDLKDFFFITLVPGISPKFFADKVRVQADETLIY